MGMFSRKASRTSTNDEEDNQSQTHSPSLAASTPPTSMNQKRPSGASNHTPCPMPLPNNPISKPPDPALDPAAYLRSIHSVRERSRLVMAKAESNQLSHFDVNMDMFENTAKYVVSIIKVRTVMLSPVIRCPLRSTLPAGLRR